MEWVKIPRKNMEVSFRKKERKRQDRKAEWQKCVGGAGTAHRQGRLLY